ncbi:hypothetical protein BJ912DRAFT_964814 [Pholiota molesta]|nr:hypothetical protein BJ912DRAFT_964814 [Pholiota molesta]
MTALASRPGPSSLSTLPSINHRCLRRMSLRTYELADPARPGAELSYDVGQVRDIVQMDKRLREQGVVAPVPAGFHEFATCFNHMPLGRTFCDTVIQRSGSPIVWEHFKIDDWLVGWNRDPANQEPSASTSFTSAMVQSSQIPLPLFDIAESTVDPKLKDLSTRMRVAIQTTDELTKFWIKSDETSRSCHQIAVDLESRCVELQMKQRIHWRDVYEPAARKLHHDQVRGLRRRSGRLQSMKALDFSPNNLSSPLSESSVDSPKAASGPAHEWEMLRNSCLQLEMERCKFMEESLGAFLETSLIDSLNSYGQRPLTPLRGPPPPREVAVASFPADVSKTSNETVQAIPRPLGREQRSTSKSSARERAHRSLGGFGIHKPTLLPFSSELDPNLPASKFANVFQRSNLSRNERNDHGT